MSSEQCATFRSFWDRCKRLKITLLLLIACWGLLIWEYPGPGDMIPQWWTAIYIMAKVGIGILLAMITKELLPFVNLSHLYTDYKTADQRRPLLVLARAVMFGLALLSVSIIMATIIYSVATIW